jgi:hypothetical protein
MPPETHEHEHKDLYSEVLDIINVRKSPDFDTYSGVKQFGLIITELLEAGCELAHTVKDEQELTAALYKVWDELLVPIDLPISDSLEWSIEFGGRQLIGPIIHGVYLKLADGKKPA